MIRILLVLFAAIMLMAAPVLAASGPVDSGWSEANVRAVWPEKASWVGQTATFFLPKITEKSTYLFIVTDPAKPITGVEQKALAEKLNGKSFVIKGLYYHKTKPTAYYWYLVAPSGETAVWVRDYNLKAADLPFSLPAEITDDLKAKEELAGLTGKTVWYNRNLAVFKDGAAHLEALEIVSVTSAGPFSASYHIVAKNKEGATLEWKTGPLGTPPVYSNSGLKRVLKDCLYFDNPQDQYPAWTDQDWADIRSRTIRQGWTKEKVLLSWGRPQEVQPNPEKAGEEIWGYQDKTSLFVKKDVIVKILAPRETTSTEADKSAQAPGNRAADKKASDKIEVTAITKK